MVFVCCVAQQMNEVTRVWVEEGVVALNKGRVSAGS